MNNNVKAINTMTTAASFAESVQQEATTAGMIGFEKTQAQVKQSMEKAMKTAEEVVSFSQGNFEAVVKSSQIWAAGLQDLSKQMAATAQAQLEETMAMFKSFSGVKSLKDVMDMQTSLARTSMEKAMTEGGRITDASIKLAEQAIAPLTARMTVAVEKFSKAV
jgi:phasin family protein